LGEAFLSVCFGASCLRQALRFAARYSLGPAPASWLGLALRATAAHR